MPNTASGITEGNECYEVIKLKPYAMAPCKPTAHPHMRDTLSARW